MIISYLVFILLLSTFGAIVMSLEILSANLMSPFFGGSIYTWGGIISSFMLNMSFGYYLGGLLAKKTKRFSFLIVLLIVSSVWVIFIPQMNHPISEFVSNLINDIRIGTLIVMTLIFFLPILIMAMISPYIIGIIGEHIKESKFNAGLILFVSTIGSFFGTNITSFYLINAFNVSQIIYGLGLIGLLLSIFSLFVNVDKRLKKIVLIKEI
jgi:MFS family permease